MPTKTQTKKSAASAAKTSPKKVPIPKKIEEIAQKGTLRMSDVRELLMWVNDVKPKSAKKKIVSLNAKQCRVLIPLINFTAKANQIDPNDLKALYANRSVILKALRENGVDESDVELAEKIIKAKKHEEDYIEIEVKPQPIAIAKLLALTLASSKNNRAQELAKIIKY